MKHRKSTDEYFRQEWAKMLNGEIYDAVHPEFLRRLSITRQKLWKFNQMLPDNTDAQNDIIRGLMGKIGTHFHINAPFRCDYGCNIHIGERFFANFNLTILDEAVVTIGDDVFIGPNVSIFTACHPIDPKRRNTGIEWAEPVTIGNSVWIGGDATILPGVTIGDNVVVGAGAVVARDVPDSVVVVGNPARIIKHIDVEADGSSCRLGLD